MRERYTPGHTPNAVEFMSKRTLDSHGAFFLPHIREGMSVLDCGCGPGTITVDIAARIAPGQAVGVDSDESQLELARENARAMGLKKMEFRHGSVYELPVPDASFEAVFSHALLEHLADPGKAIREFDRVLEPGGLLAVCSPDWGGFLLTPPSNELREAIEAYKVLQTANGGDVYVGRSLGLLLDEAGFVNIQTGARYEVYDSLDFIGEYLAIQLEDGGEDLHAETMRRWAREPLAMFAQAWVWCIGEKAR